MPLNESRHLITDPLPVLNPSRLDYVDSLRGISALLVVFSHAFSSLTYNELNLNIGKVGVFIFFMISGFVIPFSLKNGDAPYSKFIISRFFRLYPAYWLSIVLACAVMLLSDTTFPSWKTILANATMLQMGIGIPNIIGVYWTLFIEVIFYFSCVVLFGMKILQKPSKIVTVFILLCGASLFFSALRYLYHAKLPVAVPLGLTLMYFGCAWRFFVVDHSALVKKLAPIMLSSLVAVTALSSYLSYSWDSEITETWESYAVAYALAPCLFVFFTTKFRIESTVAVFFGAISYSLYLVHHPIIDLFKTISMSYFQSIAWPMLLAAILVSIVFSYFVFRFIEMPSVRLGKKLGTTVSQSEPIKT